MAEENPSSEATPQGGEGQTPANDQKPDAGQGGEEEGKESPKGEEDLDPEKHEIPQKKGAKDFIIQRQRAKIEKLKTKETEEGEEGGETPESDTDLTPESKNAIDRYLAERIKPLQDAQEIADYVSRNPEHKKYARVVDKYMQSKGYEGVPAEIIFKSLAYDDAQKIGADKAREADRKSRESKTPSGQRDFSKTGEPDFMKMGLKEFEDYRNKLITGQIKPN